MRISLASGPAVEPLSYAELKDHLRIDIADDNALLDVYAEAARAYVEEITGSALVTQTWDYWLDDWPSGDTLYIPRPPLQSITYVKYYDEDNVEATWSAASYYVDTIGKPGRLVLNDGYDWPTTVLRPANAVNVRFVAGYGDAASDVPAALVYAMRLMVGDMYENRENSIFIPGLTLTELPFGVRALIRPYDLRSHRVYEQ